MENPEAAVDDGSRLQAAIDAIGAAPEGVETQEAPEEENGTPLDSDQPITPGEDNVEELEAAPEAEPEEPVEAESSKLASLARRERRSREQSKEREDKLVAREKDLDERLKKAEEMEGRFSSLKDGFKYDPVSALKDLGIEEGYADVASALYDEELGADAPAGNKQNREIRELRDRLKKFEEDQVSAKSKQQEERQQAETLAFQQKYVGEMESYMKSETKDLSYADAFYRENPEEAIQAMYGMAYNAATEDPSAVLPTPQALAEALNQNLETTLAPVIDAILAARTTTTEVETIGEEEPIAPTETRTLRNAQSRRTQKQAPAKTEEERVRRALQMLSAG
jgi:hypothetical protein